MGRAWQGSSVVDEGDNGIPPPLVPVPVSGNVRGGKDEREIGHARRFKQVRPARGLRAGWFGGLGWVGGGRQGEAARTTQQLHCYSLNSEVSAYGLRVFCNLHESHVALCYQLCRFFDGESTHRKSLYGSVDISNHELSPD